jgi:hypothetical protein
MGIGNDCGSGGWWMSSRDYKDSLTDNHKSSYISENEKKEEERKKHIESLNAIETTEYTVIKKAVAKYREHREIYNSDKWIMKHLIHDYKDLLGIDKVKGRWKCSRNRLDSIDFSKME